jgi:hypothetical protein
MGKRVSFSDSNLELHEITQHHTDTENALKEYYDVDGKREFLPVKFIGYSAKEVFIEFRSRIEELKKTSSLTLLSSLEAKLRIDYLKRCYKKGKDGLSKDFRAIHKQKSHRASLEEDILETWKKHYPEKKLLISELLGALKYRHWLAHGRYWEPKLGREYDYSYIYSLIEQAYKNLPLKS